MVSGRPLTQTPYITARNGYFFTSSCTVRSTFFALGLAAPACGAAQMATPKTIAAASPAAFKPPRTTRSCQIAGSGVPLVTPPVAPALDVFARILAEIGRADDEDLEAVRPGLVASPRTGRDADRVPLP